MIWDSDRFPTVASDRVAKCYYSWFCSYTYEGYIYCYTMCACRNHELRDGVHSTAAYLIKYQGMLYCTFRAELNSWLSWHVCGAVNKIRDCSLQQPSLPISGISRVCNKNSTNIKWMHAASPVGSGMFLRLPTLFYNECAFDYLLYLS